MTAIQAEGGKGELLSSTGISLVVSPEVFTPRIEIHDAPEGVTIAGLLAYACSKGSLQLADVPRTRVHIDGEELELRDSLDVIPPLGSTVNLSVTVHGSSARTFVQLFFQVAAVVVSFFNPALGTAIALVGTIVTQVFFKPGKPDQLADANDRGALQDQANEYRRRSSFPVVGGRMRVGFDVAALPYTQLVGNDVWLHVIFGVHYGPCTLEALKIGETLVSDLPAGDVQVETFLTPGPRNVLSYPSRVSQESFNDDLDLAGSGTWEVRTAAEGVDRIELDYAWSQGLKYTNDKGKIGTEEVTGRIEYAEEGTEAWQAAPIGQFRNKSNQVLPAGTWYVMDRSNEPVRRTFGFNVDKSKRWKVRTKAWDNEGRYPDDKAVMATAWTALRGIERTPPILDQTLSIVALRVKSSGDLNGTLPLVTGVVTPIVPKWNAVAQAWGAEGPSSNAAEVARWLCIGPAPAKPFLPAEIDESFGVAAELITEHEWEAAIDFREEITLADALAALGRMGRFTSFWNGSALCAVTDWEKPAPRQLFSGRNVEGYKYRRAFQDEPHAVFVEFKNNDREGAGDELIVYADGYTAATAEEFISLRLDFACTANRAYREGRVFLAKRKLQTESHEWTAGIESIISTYGDRVLVRHATALWGVAEARVRARRMAGELVASIRLSDPVVMEPGKVYAIDIQRADQIIRGQPVATVPGLIRDLVFPSPIPVDSCPEPGDLIAFGEVGFVTEDLEIVDIEPDGDKSALIRAVRYAAPEIMAAETGPIPAIPNLLTPKPVAPKPRLVGAPQGSPEGVIVPFDIDPMRAGTVEGFSCRWRVNVETPEGGSVSWTYLPQLQAADRQMRTPPIPGGQHVAGDIDARITVDVEIRSFLRNGDRSAPLIVTGIEVRKGVPAPLDFFAEGVIRSAGDGSSYSAINAGCDSIEAGDLQELRIEVAPDTGSGVADDSATWRALGQPLPAANPVGDFRDVNGGESYAIRAQWVTQDGWRSPWVKLDGASRIEVPAGGNVSNDTVNVGGTPAPDVRDQASQVPGLQLTLQAAQAVLATHEATLYTATTGLVAQTAALFSQLNAPSTGVVARLTAVETQQTTDNSAAVTRLNAIEATVNTPGTGLTARMVSAESAIVANNSAAVTRLNAIEATVNTPGTGLTARMGTAESAIVANNTATVTRLNAIEATVNTPGTGLTALVAGQATAISNLQLGKADATRVALVEARVSGASPSHTSNPDFDDYPAEGFGNLPVGWGHWSGVGSYRRVPDMKGGYSVEMGKAGEVNVGLVQLTAIGLLAPDTSYVYEVEAELLSGANWTGAGLYILSTDAGGSGIYTHIQSDFATTPDSTGVVSATRPGRRSWSFIFRTSANADHNRRLLQYAMAGWSPYGSVGDSKEFVFHRMSYRPASALEVEQNAARGPYLSLSARYAASETSIADLQTGKASVARVEVLEARSGGPNMLPQSQFFSPELGDWLTNIGAFAASLYVHPNPTTGPGNGELPLVAVMPAGSPGSVAQFVSPKIPWNGATRACGQALRAWSAGIEGYILIAAYDADLGYLGESPNIGGPSGGGIGGIGPLASWAPISVFWTPPAGTKYVRLVLRAWSASVYSEAWWLRPMVSEATATQSIPPPWSPSSAEARVSDLRTALSTLEGRLEGRLILNVVAGNQVAGGQLLAVDGPDGSYSVIDWWAQAFRVSNGGSNPIAPFEVRGDVVRMRSALIDRLSVTTAITVGSFAFPVALEARLAPAADGETISYGGDLGQVPSLFFRTDGLDPLNAGETYLQYAEGHTSTGFIARRKIQTPATPSSYNLTGTVAGPGGSGPALMIERGGNPVSADNTYIVTGSGYVTFRVFLTEVPEVSDGAYGSATFEIMQRISGVWSVVGYLVVYVNSNYEPGFGSGASNDTVYGTDSATVTCSPSVEAWGLRYYGQDGGNNGGLSNLVSVSYTAQGTGSGVRSATSGGQRPIIEVRIKNA